MSTRLTRLLVGGVTGVLLVAAIAALAWQQFQQRKREAAARVVMTGTVVRGPIDHILVELGELESSNNVYVVCEVKSRGKQGTQILWVIEDGSYVRKGDIVAELDSSALEEQLLLQRIAVTNAEAALIQSTSQKKTAEIALKQYMEGTYQSERKTLLSEVARAEQDLRTAELALASGQRLVDKAAMNQLQIKSAEFAVDNATNALDDAQSRLLVLEQLTREKFSVQLNGDIGAADAKYRSDSITLREQVEQMRELEDQIAKCSIRAPVNGFVVYNNILGRGRKEWIVEAGAYVREQQVILKIPDLTKMQVKAHFNETQVQMVREGAAATISVDALPGLTMAGRVDDVKKWAKKDRFGTYVREFATYITVLDPPPEIQVGMTCEVQVLVDHLTVALQVPTQCIYEHKERLFCLRQLGEDQWETVEVTIAANNDSMVVVTQGLEEGDVVALDPRQRPELLELPQINLLADRDLFKQLAQEQVSGPRESPSRKKWENRSANPGRQRKSPPR